MLNRRDLMKVAAGVAMVGGTAFSDDAILQSRFHRSKVEIYSHFKLEFFGIVSMWSDDKLHCPELHEYWGKVIRDVAKNEVYIRMSDKRLYISAYGELAYKLRDYMYVQHYGNLNRISTLFGSKLYSTKSFQCQDHSCVVSFEIKDSYDIQ